MRGPEKHQAAKNGSIRGGLRRCLFYFQTYFCQLNGMFRQPVAILRMMTLRDWRGSGCITVNQIWLEVDNACVQSPSG